LAVAKGCVPGSALRVGGGAQTHLLIGTAACTIGFERSDLRRYRLLGAIVRVTLAWKFRIKAASNHSMALKQAANGLSLTHEELTASYAIIRHNVRTYQSAGVVEVVRGKQNAESSVKKFEDSQGSADRHEGWRYFFEKTNSVAGTDPAQATRRRQAELEKRESNAPQEADTPIRIP